MAFTVETGSGTPGANAYCSVAFATTYLTDRNRETENSWDSLATAVQQAHIIAATDYIETRWGGRFKGAKLRSLISGRAASGAITFSGLPTDGETFVVGLKTYRFVDTLAQENDVLIGADIAACVANAVSALAGTGLGATVQEDTLPNYEAFGVDQSPVLAVTAGQEGENGNLITFTESIANATITGSGTLEDGIDEGEQPLSFPRVGLFSYDGRVVVGVPLKLKQATVEYAVRSAGSPLAPDPSTDARLVPVIMKKQKVGSLEETTEYAEGGQPTLIKPYPAADRLLQEYVTAAGGTMRN